MSLVPSIPILETVAMLPKNATPKIIYSMVFKYRDFPNLKGIRFSTSADDFKGIDYDEDLHRMPEDVGDSISFRLYYPGYNNDIPYFTRLNVGKSKVRFTTKVLCAEICKKLENFITMNPRCDNVPDHHKWNRNTLYLRSLNHIEVVSDGGARSKVWQAEFAVARPR